ncbi:MAG: iron-containing alcohol dehydrogenase [Hespellia sp.]|nr:iron-containing alcohol dehydrogenase [Hespellia sp.]
MAHKFRIAGSTYIGKDALSCAEKEVCGLGDKAFIVTGKSMIKQGYVDKLVTMLKNNQVESVVFSEISGEPTDKMIEQGVHLYQTENCDFIIGFGGGSPLDSAKAIGVLAESNCKISDYNGREITHSIPPLVEIPSTAGTGSETTPFTIITDTEHDIKMLLKGDSLMPTIAIVDPMFSMQTPRGVTVATGLDALTHAIEAFSSRKAFSESDLFALSAVERIFKYLLVAVKNGNDEEAREQMAIAAFEAGVSFSNSSVTIVHGMSRPIGALFHVPHGISNAMLLSECLSYVADGAYDRFAVLGRKIGSANMEDDDRIATDKFISAVSALCKACEVPTLSKYGIDREQFMNAVEKMADDALASGSPANTRKPVGKEDIVRIYHNLWK